MMHTKFDRGALSFSPEIHAEARTLRSRAVASAIAWLVRYVGEMMLVYRSKKSLRELRDDELHELGVTRAEVERAGWF